jgi:hypothetical protein
MLPKMLALPFIDRSTGYVQSGRWRRPVLGRMAWAIRCEDRLSYGRCIDLGNPSERGQISTARAEQYYRRRFEIRARRTEDGGAGLLLAHLYLERIIYPRSALYLFEINLVIVNI